LFPPRSTSARSRPDEPATDNADGNGLTPAAARPDGARHAAGGAPRVLLLTSGLGSGHVRATEALGAAVHRLEPGAHLRQLDFWSLMNPGVVASIKRRYLNLVLDDPGLYARLHRLDECSWRRVIENDIPPPAEVVELIERFTPRTNSGLALRCGR
jgi:TctA family transporter